MFLKKLLGLGKDEYLNDEKVVEMGIATEALSIIKEATNKRLELSVTRAMFEEDKVREIGVSFMASLQGIEDLVMNLQSKLRPFGLIVIILERSFGLKKACKIGVIPENDPFEILKILQTNGENSGISNHDILVKLKDWNKRYPFDLIGVNHDWVEIQFSYLPEGDELISFAKEIYAFCPDIVEQGSESIEGLIEELTETKNLFLWWD
ncbi:DUF4253 domain-containing protein [Peribacillus acanthi]|uniref:DUF4253 domain-containing protein n=1 Tax=Peribacillus acanthi TaxID=2171554 RepID=UPI000D3E45DC|nr:DUF4253 domain-containing protein [Peribacillus acanthi]